MKKNEKGFTLIELLAVIVVLGIIMTVAGTAVIGQKKNANQKEVESIYNDIKAFGADVYLSEKDSITTDKVYFDTNYLMNNGYLKSNAIKNPAGNGNCDVYLLIDKTSSDDMFGAYVECTGLNPKGDVNPADEASGYVQFEE